MPWIVEFADDFETEFDALPESVQDELLAQAKVLERFYKRLIAWQNNATRHTWRD